MAKQKKLSEEINELLEMGKKRLAFKNRVFAIMDNFAKDPANKDKYYNELVDAFTKEAVAFDKSVDTLNNNAVEGEIVNADDLPF